VGHKMPKIPLKHGYSLYGLPKTRRGLTQSLDQHVGILSSVSRDDCTTCPCLFPIRSFRRARKKRTRRTRVGDRRLCLLTVVRRSGAAGKTLSTVCRVASWAWWLFIDHSPRDARPPRVGADIGGSDQFSERTSVMCGLERPAP